MEIYVSNKSGVPLHRQIYESLRRKIMSGELKGGDALPTVRGLARDLKISMITTARAYRDLERDGYIVTAVGRGSFVAEMSDELKKEERLREAEELLVAAAEKAALSGLNEEEFVRLARGAYPGGEK
ncbi:MAG TPA: GntR family transcriptional regulator [Candidatus Protoclostridium stercorigallinarum]|uniref:GntR family transcriptional regulator n=1 Tax=Candidatus Protoclostridium stercorigallinarum TaxID=2838741 RepID=A0A9D1TQZ0_9FIRM|nr:GntR family transcriptional regulator [Candidatus Protoclostridium stercorigallinarum]